MTITAEDQERLRRAHQLRDSWIKLIETYRRHLLQSKSNEAIASSINYLKRFTKLLSVEPDEVTRAELIRALAQFTASRQSRNTLIGRVRRFFTWAHETARISSNQAQGFPTLIGLPEGAVEAALPRLRATIENCNDQQRIIILLAACTGLRSAEIARLHHDDISAETNTITITGPDSRHNRIIPTPAPLIDELGARRQGWILPSAKAPGEHLHVGSVQRLARAALPEDVDVEMLRALYAHDLYSDHPILTDALLAKEATAS